MDYDKATAKARARAETALLFKRYYIELSDRAINYIDTLTSEEDQKRLLKDPHEVGREAFDIALKQTKALRVGAKSGAKVIPARTK